MFKHIILLWLTVGAVLCGCSRDAAHPDLAAADAVMESAPDSALAVLEAIDCSTFSPADSDYYALLMTQARVKNHIFAGSDSLISRAREAYRYDSDLDLRRRAAFYSAQANFFAGNFRGAMRDAIEAYELAKSESNDYWHAKAAELIADIYSETCNYAQVEHFNLEAINKYLSAGKELNHRYSICNLATCYTNQGRYDEAISLLDSLRRVIYSEQPFDYNLNNYLIGSILPALKYTGREQEFEQNYTKYNISSEYEDILSKEILNGYVVDDNVIANNEHLSRAYEMAEDSSDSIRVMYVDYCNAMTLKQFERAALLSDTLITLQSRVAREMLNESVTIEQRDYYELQSAINSVKSRHLKWMLLLLAAIFLVSIVFTTVIYRLKLRNKRCELELLMSELRTVQNNSTEIIEDLFKEKWKQFNSMCNEYFAHGKSQNLKSVILHDIEKKLDELRKHENLRSIVDSVDLYMGNIMTKLQNECSFLKEDDIILLSLTAVGFSAKTISLLTGMKYKNVYQRKSRILQHISDSNAQNKEIFLKKFS